MTIKLPVNYYNQTMWAVPTKDNKLPGKGVIKLKFVGVYATKRRTTILLSPAKSLICYRVNASEINKSIFTDKLEAMIMQSKRS